MGDGIVTRKCPHCGERIRGNGYFRHIRFCAKKPRGLTKKLYPIDLPELTHRRFLEKCRAADQTMAERVWELIEADIGR